MYTCFLKGTVILSPAGVMTPRRAWRVVSLEKKFINISGRSYINLLNREYLTIFAVSFWLNEGQIAVTIKEVNYSFVLDFIFFLIDNFYG